MMSRWGLAVIGVCLALLLTILGSLTRGGSYDVAEPSREIKDDLPARADYDSAWEDHLRLFDQALQEGNTGAAVLAWTDAYSAALGSHGWEGMIAVGDAALGLDPANELSNGPRARARTAYLTALMRARRDQSVEGVLRTAEAFAALDDRAVVEQCLRMAESFAAPDSPASRRVSEFRTRWAAGNYGAALPSER